MSSLICSIDIGRDLLVAVMLQTEGRKKTVIVNSSVEIVDSRPIEEVFTTLLEKIQYQGESCHVSFSADSFQYRNPSLPFSDRKTIDKVLPFELEELISENSDEIVVDSIIDKGSNGKGNILAAILSKEFLASWLATMKSSGVDPETITVSGLASVAKLLKEKTTPEEFLYLYIGLRRATLIQVKAGVIHFIRSLIFDPGMEVGYQFDLETHNVSPLRPENIEHAIGNFCNELYQTSLAIGCPSQTTVYVTGAHGNLENIVDTIKSQNQLSCIIIERDDIVDMEKSDSFVVGDSFAGLFSNAIDLPEQSAKGSYLMNFRKDDFALKRTFAQNKTLVKSVLALILLVCVGAFAYLFYDYTQIIAEKDAVEKKISKVFKMTLPEVKRIVDPIQQLQVEVNNLKANSIEQSGGRSSINVLDILAEISRLIPKSLDVALKRMIIDDKGVRVIGFTDNFNTVDAIKKALDQSAVFIEVDINSANLDQKSSKIKFELKLNTGGM